MTNIFKEVERALASNNVSKLTNSVFRLNHTTNAILSIDSPNSDSTELEKIEGYYKKSITLREKSREKFKELKEKNINELESDAKVYAHKIIFKGKHYQNEKECEKAYTGAQTYIEKYSDLKESEMVFEIVRIFASKNYFTETKKFILTLLNRRAVRNTTSNSGISHDDVRKNPCKDKWLELSLAHCLANTRVEEYESEALTILDNLYANRLITPQEKQRYRHFFIEPVNMNKKAVINSLSELLNSREKQNIADKVIAENIKTQLCNNLYIEMRIIKVIINYYSSKKVGAIDDRIPPLETALENLLKIREKRIEQRGEITPQHDKTSCNINDQFCSKISFDKELEIHLCIFLEKFGEKYNIPHAVESAVYILRQLRAIINLEHNKKLSLNEALETVCGLFYLENYIAHALGQEGNLPVAIKILCDYVTEHNDVAIPNWAYFSFKHIKKQIIDKTIISEQAIQEARKTLSVLKEYMERHPNIRGAFTTATHLHDFLYEYHQAKEMRKCAKAIRPDRRNNQNDVSP